jgi:hypothetical protein
VNAEGDSTFDMDGYTFNWITADATLREFITVAFGSATPILSMSGNEITDALRSLNVQGDGRASDSSVGMWDAATNLFNNGGSETNSTNWVAKGAATRARSTLQAKFGTTSQKVDTTGAAGDGVGDPGGSVPASASLVYTLSVWVYSLTAIQFTINWSNYTSGMAFISNSQGTQAHGGTGWERLILTATTPATTAFIGWWIDNFNFPQAFTYYVDGVQFEQGEFATPYIETNGATVTRNGARVQAPASLIDETQGWVAARIRPSWGSADNTFSREIFDWRDDNNNRMGIFFTSSGDLWRAQRRAAAAGADLDSAAQSFAKGAIQTVIMAWTATVIKIGLNGAAFTSVANTAVPVLAIPTWDIGSLGSGGGNLSGEFLWVACGTGTLSDADSATIHGLGNSDPLFGSLPGTPKMVWPAVDASYITTAGPSVTTVMVPRTDRGMGARMQL